MKILFTILMHFLCADLIYCQTAIRKVDLQFGDWGDYQNESGCTGLDHPNVWACDLGILERFLPAYDPGIGMRVSHGCPSHTLTVGGPGMYLTASTNLHTNYPSTGTGIILSGLNIQKGRTYSIALTATFRDYYLNPNLGYNVPSGGFPTLQVMLTNNTIVPRPNQCNVGIAINISGTSDPTLETTTTQTIDKTMLYTFTATSCYNFMWINLKPHPVGQRGSITLRVLTIDETTPNTTINGDNTLCSGSKSYSIANLTTTNDPLPGSVIWSAAPAGIVSITQPPAGSSAATITQVGNGIVTLTATVNNATCTGSKSFTKQVVVGLPPIAVTTSNIDGCGKFVQASTTNIPGATKYNWTLDSYQMQTTTNSLSIPKSPALAGQPPFPLPAGSHTLRVTYQNACGVSLPFIKPLTFSTTSGSCSVTSALSSDSLVLSPNPANSEVNIELISLEEDQFAQKRSIEKAYLIDKFGIRKREYNFQHFKSRKQLLLLPELPSDVYSLMVYDGIEWRNARLIIK